MINRRQFLARSGGLCVAMTLPLASARGLATETATGGALTAYLVLQPDGRVLLYSPTSEMGQGTHTGHAVVIADELNVDLSAIDVETPEPTDAFRRNGSMSSGGSWGMRGWHEPLRKAAAQAREMLLAAAAAEWGLDPSTLGTEPGYVVHSASGLRKPYAELAAAAGTLTPPAEPALRDLALARYRGQAAPRVDIPAKVRGEPIFASDVERPGMVYACARLSPVFGAEVAAMDPAPALAVAGVIQVVAIPGGAAVVAGHSYAAIQGARALDIRFAATGHDSLDSAAISEAMRAGLEQDALAVEARSEGDLAAGMANAVQQVEAIYEAPYLAHAPMEPWTCTVEFDDQGDLHLWAPSQAQDRFLKAAAETAGLPPERVHVHTTRLGGGFGRRLGAEGIPGAVLAARAVGRPVKFFWQREDEFAQGWYRPAQVARLRAGLDAEGRITALDVRTAGPSLVSNFFAGGLKAGQLDGTSVQSLRDSRYRAPALRIDWVHVPQPVPMAPWRAVGATQNGYFLECALEEVARAAGRDPLDIRRELLAHDPRALKVIEQVAERAGWGSPVPEGRARGMAYVESYGSLCAQVAEISREAGRVVVHKVTCVLDCGSVVLPDAVRAQIQGGIVQGLSTALHEQVKINGGGANNLNFDRYPILRMDEAPLAIDVVLVESGEAMGGVGEPPVPPTAPAIVNALAALDGKPRRRLPLN
ncbi:MAG: molybdopterin cofactor-binding domain-containing protein [Steroidobacteraceae bacterium]